MPEQMHLTQSGLFMIMKHGTILGFHSQSVDAPLISVNSVSPVFITDQTEIEFSAAVTTPAGSVSSVIVKYGTNGQLLNEADAL